MSGASLAPTARRQRDEILRAFRASGTVAVEEAKSLDQLGLRRDESVRRLLHKGVLVEEQGHACWLDERREALEASRRRRWRVVLVLLLVLLFTALALVLV